MNPLLRPYQLDAPPSGSELDSMVQITFNDLTSQFMTMPRGNFFVGYEDFRSGYEALRMATGGFTDFDPDLLWKAIFNNARAFMVLRAILGVSPPEWADLTKEETDVLLPSGAARTYDGGAKRDPTYFSRATALTQTRVKAMLQAARAVLLRGVDEVPDGLINRLDKFDTQAGLEGIAYASEHHVPYAVLLYERYLGRPFASHRDAVSESVGDVMESAIESLLAKHHVPFRKTKRAERVPGFDQAPDFFIPDEVSPAVIIEAKITGDDGTARDKVARIFRLGQMRDELAAKGMTPWQLVACIDGRGFGIRKQDMRDLLTVTKGKVFTLNTLEDLISHTDLRNFVPPGH